MTNTTKIKLEKYHPDDTLYKEIKNISLVHFPVTNLKKSNIPFPDSLSSKNHHLNAAWLRQHAPMIKAAYKNLSHVKPLRSIFPGPYIPWLSGRMDVIGDTALSVFLKIIETVKERIPDLNLLHRSDEGYSYENNYFPLINKIVEPEEAWEFKYVECPTIDGIHFPLPLTYGLNQTDKRNLKVIKKMIFDTCNKFYDEHVGVNKKRTHSDIRTLISFIRCLEYLHNPHITHDEIEAFNETLRHFDLVIPPVNRAALLFEIDHTVSYLSKLSHKDIVLSCPYGMAWIDVMRLPIENLIETELGDIHRVLREIRSFFSVGWAPILIHLSGDQGYNTDGTHRHYALLTIELLRRIKNKLKLPIRSIDINSASVTRIIHEFSWRYKKVGLSLRETLRTVNYLVNNDIMWPYTNFLDNQLIEMKDRELRYVPSIYLPEWRARSIVKSLCDKGIALVGVPPINIEIVGSSNGKKGIFIRGGYHGDDRQPNLWFNMLKFQNT